MSRYHFIGIGGAGMSVVAELFLASGNSVSGSDKTNSPVLQHLREAGAHVWVGHDASHVPADATVVVSTAVRETNPELACARQRGQEVIHRSRALALAAQGMRFVAVAGAHGKTTTSGMLAVALSHAGYDPSAAIGSVVPQFGSGAHMGSGDVFIAEADESDGSFLNYTPTIALVTNVEPDHLDHYGTQEAFEQVFVDFSARLVPHGVLVCCAEDEGAARLAQRVAPQRRVVTYGRADRSVIPADLVITDVELQAEGARAILCYEGEETELHLHVPGEHNVLNAAGAWLVGRTLGVHSGVMAEALSSFTGTARRFELRGEAGGRRVFDDYAHHPTEVSAALAQARTVAGQGTVSVVFQPHLYSRTKEFAQRFATALSAADVVVLTDVYAAREDPMDGVDSTLISSQIPHSLYVPDMFEATRVAARKTPVGGVLVTMGAGSITSCAPAAVEVWEAQGSGQG